MIIILNDKLGGRDLRGTRDNPKNLRTAAQTKDQTLARGNLALSLNYYNRKPGNFSILFLFRCLSKLTPTLITIVRVIRGYKLGSVYAPVEGYR